MKTPIKRKLIDSKKTFLISLLSIAITIISVWFYGLGKHTTVIENSLLSTSILSLAFFLFIAISLYNGIKLKDNLGNVVDAYEYKQLHFLKEIFAHNNYDIDFDFEDGFAGAILSIILWFIMSIVISYLFFILGTIIWLSILVFLGMLYWMFFRALRLIFKKAPECYGKLDKSIYYGLTYTLLYNFWIYGIILLSKFY